LGYDTINDITACPGTDTCNLGIASSTGIEELERVLKLDSRNKENKSLLKLVVV
jgi:sulfite reductase (ferredoxin)